MNTKSKEPQLPLIDEMREAIETEYPETLVLCKKLSDADRDEYGADWTVDVFFVPSGRLLELEDYTNPLAYRIFQECRCTVLVLAHTVEATKEHYLDTLERLCPDRLLARLGQGIAVTEWAEVAQATPAYVINIPRGGDRLPYGSGDAARKAA